MSPHLHWQKSFATISVTRQVWLQVSLTQLTLTKCQCNETNIIASLLTKRLIRSSNGDCHTYPFCITTPGTTSQCKSLSVKLAIILSSYTDFFRSQNYSVSVTRVAPIFSIETWIIDLKSKVTQRRREKLY